jgi:uncharacterized protein (TIGR00730 family)
MDESKLKKSTTTPRVTHELFKQGEEDTSITSWRMFRIMSELVSGFELLKKYDLAVTIYGSARAPEWTKEYMEAERLAKLLVDDGFAVITGGGSGGIMRGANKGAYEAGGDSIGLNIELPEEQHLNGFTTDSRTFHFFFTRKVALAFASEVYIFFPGGFGTLDEFFEIITLVQTKKIPPVPIILFGSSFWSPLLEWMRNSVYGTYRYINEDDLEIVHVVNDAEEIHKIVHDLVTPRGTSYGEEL